MVAARIANLERGGDRKTDQTANLRFADLIEAGTYIAPDRLAAYQAIGPMLKPQ
jgi:hypothetical protein